MLEERSAILRGDREAAYRSMRELSDLAPNSEWNSLLARHALYSNRPKLAIAALAKLDPESGWIRGMGSYWAVLLDAHHRLGGYESGLSTVRRARERYLNLPWDLTVRYARVLVASGRVAEARLFMDSIAAKATHPRSEFMFRGLLMHVTGETRAHGQPLLARDWAVADSVSYPILPFVAGMSEAEALRALNILERREQWAQARPYASYLVRLNPGNHEYHMTLGTVAGRLGDRHEALRHSEWFLTAPRVRGSDHHSRAVIAAALGDSSEAVRLLKQAFADGYLFDSLVHWVFAPIRNYPPFQALMRPAG